MIGHQIVAAHSLEENMQVKSISWQGNQGGRFGEHVIDITKVFSTSPKK